MDYRLPLTQHEVAENLKPLATVKRITSPGGSDSLLLAGPSGGTTSGVAAGTRPDTPLGINSQNGGDGDSEEGGVLRAGSLRGEALRAAAIDAIHSYLVHAADYDLRRISGALNRVSLCLDLHAFNLARKSRAEQDASK